MAKGFDKEKRKTSGELDDNPRRADHLPVIDHRNPDDIVECDGNGAPNNATRSEQDVPAGRQASAVESFDFAAWKKKVLADPVSRAAVEDFLKYRHREWEQSIGSEGPRARRRGIRKP